ncbi:LTA synthase family protein [Prevotella bivia]|uniref:LTA synthase family protein n=1 Tax=Prevotella bivia TaxID=28125 RepID=UPI00288B8560|nr:sulfatase-like hydrolase/transferase [Prevotella bivia]
MLFNYGMFKDSGVADYVQVMWHGISLDLSMAGYFLLLPCLLTIVSVWISNKAVLWLWRMAIAFSALLFSFSFCLNLALYPYWKFPLDTTPLFYFLSSPADAFASVNMLTAILGFVVSFALTGAVYTLFVHFIPKFHTANLRCKMLQTLVVVLFMVVLIIPIRGGVSVSVTNIGKVYFSTNMKLNHAAVNPLFSLMESYSKEEDFSKQYRFMEHSEMERIFKTMVSTKSTDTKALLNTDKPDIYLFILESFSTKLMQTEATPQLNQLKKEGIFFENLYANSFRTDRGVVAVLSGYPAQPTTSIMKFTKKASALPSIANVLKQHHYRLKYYYGGDANFTNMRSYLTSQGFVNIVSDVDFPLKYRLSKWGVPDEYVFERLIDDIKVRKQSDKQPTFQVLQTSSSHEPFDVPYYRLKNKVLNAFAYTDHCIGNFVSYLKKSGRWNRSLIILVPDHLGCYPEDISSFTLERYQIPMLWLGGAIKNPQRVSTYGSQHDIAATLLAQLGLSHQQFLFSKDMLDAHSTHFAFFTFPDLWGIATPDHKLIYDNTSNKLILKQGEETDLYTKKGKAYLQRLYDDLSERGE